MKARSSRMPEPGEVTQDTPPDRIEAAAQACYGVTCEAIKPSFKKWPGSWTPQTWDELKEIERELHRDYARAVLVTLAQEAEQ